MSLSMVVCISLGEAEVGNIKGREDTFWGVKEI